MTSNQRLVAEGLSVGYGEHQVLHELDFAAVDGAITSVIGPNGCGKSTLLRSLGRLHRPWSGTVTLDGRSITELRTRELAQQLGVLPQAPIAPDGITVEGLVMRGRHPHQAWYSQWSPTDEDAVRSALELTRLDALATRPVDELSGGQRQRVWIALVLAQGTDVLLLDEPTTYLDVAHALDVLDLIDTLHAEHGRTVVMVLHDLNLAARYSDHMVLMHEGRIAAQGTPDDVVTAEHLASTFGLRAHVSVDPTSGRPLVVPIGTRHVNEDAAARRSLPYER